MLNILMLNYSIFTLQILQMLHPMWPWSLNRGINMCQIRDGKALGYKYLYYYFVIHTEYFPSIEAQIIIPNLIFIVVLHTWS